MSLTCDEAELSVDSSDQDDDDDDDDDDESEGASTLCYGDATKTTSNRTVCHHGDGAIERLAHDWRLGKVKSISSSRDKLIVRWYGTYAKKKPFTAQMQPGWVDQRDSRSISRQHPCGELQARSGRQTSQVRIWGVTHIVKSGYLGSAVEELIKKECVIWTTSNDVNPYRARLWSSFQETYLRQFGQDSLPALRASSPF